MTTEFEPDAYDGICEVCGTAQRFERTQRAIRETYRCSACKALLRERAQAAVILSIFPELGVRTLRELVQCADYKAQRVYEPGVAGSLRKWLRNAACYCQSDYHAPEDRFASPNGVPHQDLEALTFGDRSFDLVVSSDIFEHVRHPERALREVARVLRPGGRHVFTVPMQDPVRTITVRRVDSRGDVDIPLLPERHHGDGKGGKSLVYTDFGADIVNALNAIGFDTDLVRHRSTSPIASRVITLLSTRRHR